MKKAAFLDRDGVINRRAAEGGYILVGRDLEILPGAAEAITLLNRAGILVIVVTNQRCVARGLLTIQGLEEIHGKMIRELAGAGAHLDSIYYCPHGSDQFCDCRKPAPGMLLAAAKEHDIDLSRSWMIGDTDSDIAAGRAAGCQTVLLTRDGRQPEDTRRGATAESLLSAVQKILVVA